MFATTAKNRPATPVPASGLTLLSTVVANNSATVDVEQTFDGTFDTYLLIITGLRIGSGGTDLLARLKIDGVYNSGASDYQWALTDFDSISGTTFSGSSDTTDSSIKIAPNAPNDAVIRFSTTITITDPTQSIRHNISWQGGYLTGGNESATLQGSGAYHPNSGVFSGIRIFQDAGNINFGDFRLYGVKK